MFLASRFLPRINRFGWVASFSVLLIGGAACAQTSQSAPPVTTGLPRSDAGTAQTDLPAPGTGDDAYRYLNAYFDQGLHRAGEDGDRRVSEFMQDEFAEMGLRTDVQDFELKQFVVHRQSLTVDGVTPATFPLYYSGRTPPDGLEAELVYVGEQKIDGSAAGKIVLADVPMRNNFSAPTLNDVRRQASRSGVSGLILALQGPLNEIVAQNVSPETGLCKVPTLQVGKLDGRQLAKLAGSQAHMVLHADYLAGPHPSSTSDRIGRSRNTLGILPGSGQDLIVIAEPVTGWFGTAAERGGPFGILMTLARYYAEKYADAPPSQTLMFVGTGAHELGRTGILEFLKKNSDRMARVSAFIHTGDGNAAFLDKEVDGAVVRAPIADPNRYFFVSANPVLEAAVAEALGISGLVVPVAPFTSQFDLGDQSETNRIGVPTLGISGAHLWFHTPADTPDTTSPELLDPFVRFYIRLIDRVLQTDPSALRNANPLAEASASPAASPTCPDP